MVNTSTTYIPKIQDWVDYYGKSGVDLSDNIESLEKTCTTQPTCTGGRHSDKTPVHCGGDTNPTTISTGQSEMRTDIQVVSPVQTAVNQAMASKRRRRSKVKGRRRKAGRRKKKPKVSRKRKTKIRKRSKKKKKKPKVQRDIFNY